MNTPIFERQIRTKMPPVHEPASASAGRIDRSKHGTTVSGNPRNFFSMSISSKKFPTGGFGGKSLKKKLSSTKDQQQLKQNDNQATPTPQTSDVDPLVESQQPQIASERQQQPEGSGGAAGAADEDATSTTGGGKLRRTRSLLSLSSRGGNRSVASLNSSITSLASAIGGSLVSERRDSTGGSARKEKEKDSVDSLLRRRKWRRLVRYLSTDRGRAEVLSSSTSCALTAGDGPADGSNALHRACRAGAPLDVVRSMCSACPDLAVEVDARGRTALHVAALPRADNRGGGVPLKVIFHLMAVHGGAVSMRDRDGRLPLHLACCRREDAATMQEEDDEAAEEDGAAATARSARRSSNGSESWDGQPKKSKIGKVRMGVVTALCDEAPFAVNEEDSSGRVPPELLLISGDNGRRGNSSDEVLEYLLYRSERRWRRKLSEHRNSLASLEEEAEEERNNNEVRTISGNESQGKSCVTSKSRAEERYERWKDRRTPLMRAFYEAHAEAARRRREGRRNGGNFGGDSDAQYEWAVDVFLGATGHAYEEEEEDDVKGLHAPTGEGRGRRGSGDGNKDGDGDMFSCIEVPVDVRAKMERRISDLSCVPLNE